MDMSSVETAPPSRRTVAMQGIRAIMPMIPGIIPFALVSALAARDAGLSLLEALGLSVVVFAGASQIAFAQLLGSGAMAPVILLTVVVINLRFVMYSASLAPRLRGQPAWRRALAGYLLTDQAFAVTANRFMDQPHQPHGAWFFLGAAFPLWAVWQIITLVGLVVGARVPPEWGLDFTVPLVFLVLLVLAVRDRATAEAAVVSGCVALLLAGLPYNLGLILAAAVGIAWGVWTERRTTRRRRPSSSSKEHLPETRTEADA